MIEVWQEIVDVWLKPAAPILALGGVMVPLVLSVLRDNKTQQTDVYFKLEMEASRLFEIARQNKPMMDYLEGRPTDSDDEEILRYQLFWFLPQTLNLFEISILFRKKGIFEKDTFSTWIAWYLEVSASDRFSDFWEDLRLHYRPELRSILDSAVKLSRSVDRDLETTTELFFVSVSTILDDKSILRHYKNCLEKSNIEIGMADTTIGEHKSKKV